MKTFICLDTNIFIRYITQGMPDCEEEHWESIVSEAKKENVTFVLPEIVELELQKQWELIPKEVEAKLLLARKNLSEKLKSDYSYTEVRDFLPALLDSFDTLHAAKVAEMNRRNQTVSEFISSPSVHKIELDTDIWLSAKKRSWSGRLADPNKSSEADSVLIESLIKMFKSESEDFQLLFCSENKNDFALTVEKNEIVLHPRISDDLPRNEFFLNLKDLTSFLKKNQPAPSHTDEEVATALESEKESQTRSLADMYWEFGESVKREDEERTQRLLDLIEHAELTPEQLQIMEDSYRTFKKRERRGKFYEAVQFFKDRQDRSLDKSEDEDEIDTD